MNLIRNFYHNNENITSQTVSTPYTVNKGDKIMVKKIIQGGVIEYDFVVAEIKKCLIIGDVQQSITIENIYLEVI